MMWVNRLFIFRETEVDYSLLNVYEYLWVAQLLSIINSFFVLFWDSIVLHIRIGLVLYSKSWPFILLYSAKLICSLFLSHKCLHFLLTLSLLSFTQYSILLMFTSLQLRVFQHWWSDFSQLYLNSLHFCTHWQWRRRRRRIWQSMRYKQLNKNLLCELICDTES